MECSQFIYSTPVSSFVNKTLELEKIRRQGYRNEKEQLEKLRLLAPGLDDLKLQLNVCNFYGGVGLSSRTGPIGFPGKRYPLLEERCYLINWCIFTWDFVILLSRGKFSKLSHCLQLEVQDGQGEPQLHLVEPALKPPAGGEVNGIKNEKFFLKGIESLDIFFWG